MKNGILARLAEWDADRERYILRLETELEDLRRKQREAVHEAMKAVGVKDTMMLELIMSGRLK